MRAALVLARATLRDGLRWPGAYVIAGIGCLALWAGVSLEILAFRSESRALELGLATAEGVALLVVVLACARAVEGDAASGYGEAIDGGGAGTTLRLTGRFLGAAATALVAGIPVVVLSVVLYNQAGEGLRLPGGDWLLALPLEVALTGAWTLLFARRLPAASAVLAGLVVVVAARVGPPPALAALLPRAIDPVGPGISGFALGVEALATAGVLLAVVALPGRDAHA